MELVWKNNKIKKQVVKLAQSNQTVRKRMLQLESAPCYLDIPSSCKAHFLHGDLVNCFAIDFDYSARLICMPVGEFETDNNQFVKKTITSVEIIKVETDYH